MKKSTLFSRVVGHLEVAEQSMKFAIAEGSKSYSAKAEAENKKYLKQIRADISALKHLMK